MLADDLENPSRYFSALTNNSVSGFAPCIGLSSGVESLLVNWAVKEKTVGSAFFGFSYLNDGGDEVGCWGTRGQFWKLMAVCLSVRAVWFSLALCTCFTW